MIILHYQPHDSTYIVDVVMRPKFGNSGISMKESPKLQFCNDLTPKNMFFWRSSLGSSSKI